MSLLELATDPRQYDGNIGWSEAIDRTDPIKHKLLEAMTPYMGDVNGRRALDVGSGEGWLCAELAARGAEVVGIEPATSHIMAARRRFPGLDFRHKALDDFRTSEEFDLVTGVMVIEHLKDLTHSLGVIRLLTKATGRLVIVSSSYAPSSEQRFGVPVEVEEIAEGEVAARIDRGQKGVLYDVLRTTERITTVARKAGFTLLAQSTVAANEWPGYRQGVDSPDEPIVQIMGFQPAR